MKIFFGDLVHTWERASVWYMPLNVGYIAAYTQERFPGYEIQIFKRPEDILAAIRSEKPDIVALSCYIWNVNLDHFVMEVVKSINPKALTVQGGPFLTDLNSTGGKSSSFFSRYRNCDAYVLNQGERGFCELLKRFDDCNRDITLLKKASVPGCLINNGRDILEGSRLDNVQSLDEIPSPYLTGLLDPFFKEPFIPMIETNRSCPYRCTFCAWGIGTQKMAQFSENRAFEEVEYISKRCKKSALMRIADGNFGLFERDVSIARKIYECHKRYDFPMHLMVNWNKTAPDRLLRIAKELHGICELGASCQSLEDDVLKAINRKNMTLEKIKEIYTELQDSGSDTPLVSELIVGLPMETAKSHIETNKRVIDLGAEAVNYNLILLPGTEMDTDESRNKYFRSTGWRLCDDSFGVYEGRKIFEGLEVVTETTTMTKEELRSFRFFHFLLQFMWGRRWYHAYLNLLKISGIHPVDVVLQLSEAFGVEEGMLGRIYKEFCADHALENFENVDALSSYWEREENMKRLRDGSYGKLNSVYTYKILFEQRGLFESFLLKEAKKIFLAHGKEKALFLADICEELIRFEGTSHISFDKDMEIVKKKRSRFSYDFLEIKKSSFDALPNKYKKEKEYEFFLTKFQEKMLKRQIAQFYHENIQLIMRKMQTDMRADQFFYSVRLV
jgi:radical SAM superfamily enzyme YgiQ (UPF0313 family)